MHIHIPKYNLLIPFNVTCMYVFRANLLVLNNLPSIPRLPVVPFVRLKSPWALPRLLWHVHWCPPCSAHA